MIVVNIIFTSIGILPLLITKIARIMGQIKRGAAQIYVIVSTSFNFDTYIFI
jgi:hypothetical protein